jgi:hypothetical protein
MQMLSKVTKPHSKSRTSFAKAVSKIMDDFMLSNRDQKEKEISSEEST